MPNRPVILLAFAQDREEGDGGYLRELPKEQRGIEDALTAARRAGSVEVVVVFNATLQTIIDKFQENRGRVRVFHYGGHANSYQLLFESESGAIEAADSSGFARFLKNQQQLELVFLNGCSTRAQADELRNVGIRSVITTSKAINDEVARRFAIRFYRGIGTYGSVTQSFKDAEGEILTWKGDANTRSLYWEGMNEETEALNAFPWGLEPELGSDWKLIRPVQSGVGLAVGPEIRNVKIGKYAHVLCDRTEQSDQFESQYLARPDDNRSPQTYIIHGERDDRHESLVTRFSYEYIGRKNYIKPIDIKWPFKGNPQNLLKIRLMEQFETGDWGGVSAASLKAQDLINQTSLSGQRAIILQHSIPAESWNKETTELLEWYVGKFWNIRVDNLDAPQFIIFLNVFYSEEQQKSSGFLSRIFSRNKYNKSRIEDDLAKLAKSNSNHCQLLEELNPIFQVHIKDWLRETNLDEVEDFSGLDADIFSSNPHPKKEMMMSDVELELKKALKEFRRKYARAFM